MPINNYLFRFGYCTPAQWLANEAHGWDDESSCAFFVASESAERALEWGREVAEIFVHDLFRASGWEGSIPSWKKANFASWIEESEDEFSAEALKSLPVVQAGEVPDPGMLANLRG